MDYKKLAELLLSDIDKKTEYYENLYPQRELKEGAAVTRIAPSPTGFMHIGNLFGALCDERLAHTSDGIFYLRIEDTDQKREVEGGVLKILQVFDLYNLNFDEGPNLKGEQIGNYGPYFQRQREQIYKAYAKELILKGLAYPCFCTEEDLKEMRSIQEQNKENYGYYGKYAKHRDMSLEEIQENIDKNIPYVIRFKSNGSIDKKVVHFDLIKEKMEIPENDQDVVILKSDGIPTYHFAHVIDDHLMRTTIVVRGEEWLATLPIHLQLFDTLGFKRPKYAHTAQLMKMEGTTKRKLSKRLDPELALSFYEEQGYPIVAIKEYLMTLLNSNFEEWRLKYPEKPLEEFPFSVKKMSKSGSLFDLLKLQDICKNVISMLDAKSVYFNVLDWSKNFDEQLYKLLADNEQYAIDIFSIGRGGKKPRKDITIWSEVKAYVDFFYDELFAVKKENFPDNVKDEKIKEILNCYKDVYVDGQDQNQWFEDICNMSNDLGFAVSTKEYKQNPDKYIGHPGDVSMVIRVAISGRQNSPDMYEVTKILGKEKILKRIDIALKLFN